MLFCVDIGFETKIKKSGFFNISLELPPII